MYPLSSWCKLDPACGRYQLSHWCKLALTCNHCLLDKLQKVQNAAARFVCKAKKSDHIHPILETALATSNTSHSIQNFNYLLQLHLWNSPSVSVRSPSTLYSSKTITICIWHTNLCHPPCKHKNIWWKIFLFFMLAHLSGTICLKHSTTLILPPVLKPPSRRTCLITISKLFFAALPIPLSDTVCVRACARARACVVSVIVKRPVLPPSVVDGCTRNPLDYYYYCPADVS